MVDYHMCSLLLSTWIFSAEQVEGVILSHFYSLSLLMFSLSLDSVKTDGIYHILNIIPAPSHPLGPIRKAIRGLEPCCGCPQPSSGPSPLAILRPSWGHPEAIPSVHGPHLGGEMGQTFIHWYYDTEILVLVSFTARTCWIKQQHHKLGPIYRFSDPLCQ